MANENADLPNTVSVQEPDSSDLNDRLPLHLPRPVRYASTPSYESPQRHHRRNPIARRPVKETLNARSEYTTSQDDGAAEHRINQYVIKQEIGRGSFGAVHLAVDQYGNEYAVKEFSKSRLRKRAQSHLLRRTRGPRRPGVSFNSPLHRHPSGNEDEQAGNALYLIKEEIAIMKKLNHNNLVSLIEVLDDPTEDSLYMVMEMCKKGVIMKVGLEERADPYDDEQCRCWFRDLILGIEYLHAQGIVHRDIKPDNCLVTSDDVLKVVDFGVSEMFEKDSDMYTAKSAGSPAFLPPELCVVKHGDVSGKAADIWSMGVTLYCLRYGKLPFEKPSIFELYEAIRNDPVVCEGEEDEVFKDMMLKILEKDPAQRITMPELREHPWVTRNGTDPLLSEEENTAEIVEPPTEEEMNLAITKNMGHILAVMKAAKNFKSLIYPAKAETPMQSILGQEYETHFVQPPLEMDPEESLATEIPTLNKAQSLNTYNRKAWERDLVLKGYHQQRGQPSPSRSPESQDITSISSKQDPALSNVINTKIDTKDSGSIHSVSTRGDVSDDLHNTHTSSSPALQPQLSRANSATTKRSIEGTRGHARDLLEEEYPFLFIGPSTYSGVLIEDMGSSDRDVIMEEPDNSIPATPELSGAGLSVDVSVPIVSESPGAAEFDIYETAYREEIERIRKRSLTRRGTGTKVYLTRRVEGKSDVMRLIQEEEEAAAAASVLDQEPVSETSLQVGEKRTVPPVGSVTGLMTTQFAQHQHQHQQSESRDSCPRRPSRTSISSPSALEPMTAAIAATGVTSTDSHAAPGNHQIKLRNLLNCARGRN